MIKRTPRVFVRMGEVVLEVGDRGKCVAVLFHPSWTVVVVTLGVGACSSVGPATQDVDEGNAANKNGRGTRCHTDGKEEPTTARLSRTRSPCFGLVSPSEKG